MDGTCYCNTGWSGLHCEIEDVVINTNDSLGWSGTDDPASIPTAINPNYFGSTNSLPSSVDLTPYLPPIGNQNPYATCVAWAVGYNLKSALEAIDRGLSGADLAQANNQMSPKDLFYAIPDAEKGANCRGTNFAPAFDVLLSRGAATLQTVPYQNMGDCANSGVQGTWTSEAAGHKILNYRKIQGSVDEIKQYLYQKSPVVIGVQVTSTFENWYGSGVMASNNGQPAGGGHALIIAGYDDSRNAFRVINSWGPYWGDQGGIWIDYNFMVNGFVDGGNYYVANNDGGNVTPPVIDPTVTSSVDLAPWVFADYSTYFSTGYYNSRDINFNIYNIGDQPASASSGWGVYYLYYNAFNAYDFGILFYDEFGTSVAPGTFNCPTYDHCIFNYDIPSGSSMMQTVFQTSSLARHYFVPQTLNGAYYLVLYVDPLEKIAEKDEMNNFFYTSGQYPKAFSQGYSTRSSSESTFEFYAKEQPTMQNLRSSSYNSAVTQETRNAYSTTEISRLILAAKENGILDDKLSGYKAKVANGICPYPAK